MHQNTHFETQKLKVFLGEYTASTPPQNPPHTSFHTLGATVGACGVSILGPSLPGPQKDLLKPCPHCRRKVRLSQSHFSATVWTGLNAPRG